MLRNILTLHANRRHVLRLVSKYTSSEESIRLTNLFTGCDKSGIQESGEIINMRNDGMNIDIPRSSDFRGHFLTSDLVNVSLNERGTLDLSSNMQANTPDLPSEAVNVNDRPYDSIMSLGASNDKNRKYISTERMSAKSINEDQYPPEMNHDETMLSIYTANQFKFGVKGSDDVVNENTGLAAALEAQRVEMIEVETYWRDNGGMGVVGIFTSLLSDTTTDVELIVMVFRSLGGASEDVSRFTEGLVPLSYLSMKVDAAVRAIVDQWRLSRVSGLTHQ